jgi:AsmA protein
MSGDTGNKLRALKWTVVIAAVLVAAIIALPFLVDVNRFRPEIESRLSDALGREVRLGNLRLSILSGGVRIDDITVADNPAFSRSPFLVSKSFQAGVELKPLILSREVHITGISLDRPEITLIRSSAGRWNFSDLGNRVGNGGKASGDDSAGPSESAFSIRRVRITGGRITYINGKKAPSIYDNVDLVIHDFSASSSFPFALTASLPGGGGLHLEGKAGPLHKADIVRTPVEAELNVSGLDLVASRFVTSDSGIAGILNFRGTVDSDGGRVQSNGNVEAENMQFAKGGSPAGKPILMEYEVGYDLAGRKGTLSGGEIRSGQALARINGDFYRRGENLTLNMRVAGMGMPLQDLVSQLPAFGVILPKGASLEGGTLDADLTAKGPIERMKTAGTAEISGTRLTGFDLAGKLAALASLTGIESSNVTAIETLSSGVRLTPEEIRVSDILLIMPALGKLSGAGVIDADQSLNFAMRANLQPSGPLGTGLAKLLHRDTLNIPFFVRGTASDPKFVPDAKNVVSGILESGLSNQDTQGTQTDAEDAVGDMLNDLLGK